MIGTVIPPHGLTSHFTMNGFTRNRLAGSWSFTEVLNPKVGVHRVVRVQTIETGKMAHTMLLTPWVPQNHTAR